MANAFLNDTAYYYRTTFAYAMIDDFSPKSLPDLVCLPQGGDDSDDVDDEAEPVQHLDAAATDDHHLQAALTG